MRELLAMDRTLLWKLLLVFALPSAGFPQEAPSIARWDRAVCLVTEAKEPGGQGALGTAFLVRHSESVFLVTAAHAAQATKAGTRLVYRSIDGAPNWIHLGLLTDKAADPWRAYENSDLSVMTISRRPVTKEPLEKLDKLAIDFDCLLTDVPPRTTAIEIVGFPISLGVSPSVSPLAMKGHVASRELEAAAKWGTEPILYSVPTVGAGCSGGPVFLSTAEVDDVKVVGMYIGLQGDATGAKLSKIIPSRIIRTAIERIAETQSDNEEETK